MEIALASCMKTMEAMPMNCWKNWFQILGFFIMKAVLCAFGHSEKLMGI